jgi:hypothetical protein
MYTLKHFQVMIDPQVAESGKTILISWTVIMAGLCTIGLALIAFWKGLTMNINKKIELKANQSDLDNLGKRVDGHDIDLRESRDRSVDTNNKVTQILVLIAKMGIDTED